MKVFELISWLRKQDKEADVFINEHGKLSISARSEGAVCAAPCKTFNRNAYMREYMRKRRAPKRGQT